LHSNDAELTPPSKRRHAVTNRSIRVCFREHCYEKRLLGVSEGLDRRVGELIDTLSPGPFQATLQAAWAHELKGENRAAADVVVDGTLRAALDSAFPPPDRATPLVVN